MDKEFIVDVDLGSDDDRANESMPIDSNTIILGGSIYCWVMTGP